jgi:hypothetical protein
VTATSETPETPEGLRAAGRALWRSITGDYELEEHEERLLLEACRTADLCDDLAGVVDAEGVLVDGRTHPSVVELRQQRILLARLIVALRVPLGAESDAKSSPAPRLQRRGVRGMYGIRGSAS